MSEREDLRARPGQEECEAVAGLLVFYACDELEGDERLAVERHLAGCAACAAALERERHLVDALAAVKSEPSPALLAHCREELNEALDEADHSGAWHGLRAMLNPGRWWTLHPALSAALLLVLGIAAGRAIPGWFLRRAVPPATPPAASALSEPDLQNADISAINWQPGTSESAPASVEVHLTTEKPLVVRGTVKDHDVRRVLLYVVKNDHRCDPGERLDSVELLRSQSDSADVRKALCDAARRDPNPGVRLKALEALRGSEKDAEVRQTLLDALVRDANPGVRIEAVNTLRQLVETVAPSSDANLRRVLEDRMQNDPNTYIRLQSAAAIRQLGPRQSY